MGLLTPAEFREHVTTSLADSALQILLDAAETAIVGRVGEIGVLQDRRRGGGTLLSLSRAAATIGSVIERYGDPLGLTDVPLATDDWTLLPDGYTLRREWTGTHRNDRWADAVIVNYTALDDTAERQRVAIALVKLDISHQPGLQAQQIGDWSETYARQAATDYKAERESLLDSLASNVAWFA